METLRNTYAQMRMVWSRSGRGTQVAIVALLLVSFIVVTGVGIWAMQPQYIPVATGVTNGELGPALDALESAQIEFEISFSGSVISVAKPDWAKARDALTGIVSAEKLPTEDSSSSMFATREEQEERRLRDREREIARTIELIDAVKSARVMIGKEPNSMRLGGVDAPTASVVVTLNSGTFLIQENVHAIIMAVANAIPRLDPTKVHLADTTGRTYSSTPQGGNGVGEVARQMELKRDYEAYLTAKVRDALARWMGSSKSIVNVTAELDFDHSTETSEALDPDSKIVTEERTETKKTSGPQLSGAAGTASNLGTGGLNSSFGTTQSETTEVKNNFSTTTTTLEKPPGRIKKLSLSAVVDLSGLPDDADSPKPTVEEIQSYLETTAGLDQTRDTVKVVLAKLPDPEPVTETVAPGGWEQVRDIVQVVSLGLASVVAFIFGWLTLRRVKPITVESTEEAEARRARLVAEITDHASRDPETVSRIVAAWLNEPLKAEPETEPDDSEPEEPPRAAA